MVLAEGVMVNFIRKSLHAMSQQVCQVKSHVAKTHEEKLSAFSQQPFGERIFTSTHAGGSTYTYIHAYTNTHSLTHSHTHTQIQIKIQNNQPSKRIYAV
jgi:hypothetical protein